MKISKQLCLFDMQFQPDPKKEKRDKINKALEKVRHKYGEDIVTKGSKKTY